MGNVTAKTSGEIASFMTPAKTNIKSLKVHFSPKQNLHGYSKPWVAGSGKNLCPDLAHMTSTMPYPNIIYEYNPDTYTWKIIDDIGGNTQTWRQARFFFDASAMAGKRVCLSYQSFTRHFGDVDSQVGMSSISFVAGGASVWVSPDQNKKWIDVPSDVDLTNAEIGFRLAQENGGLLSKGAYIEVVGLQIEVGDTGTDFEPYENICPIDGWDGVEAFGSGKNLLINDDPLNPNANYYKRTSTNPVIFSESEKAFTVRKTIEDIGNVGICEANHAKINATKSEQSRLFIAPQEATYIFSVEYKNVGANYGLRFYKVVNDKVTRLGDIHGDADEQWHIRSFTVSLNKGDSFKLFIYPNIYWRNMQIEIANTPTDYEPYQGNNISYQWKLPDEYQEVEWIKSNGHQFIQLPFGFDDTDEVDTVFSIEQTQVDKYIVAPKTWNNNNNRFGFGRYIIQTTSINTYTIAFGGSSTGLTYLEPATTPDMNLHRWIYKNRVFTMPELGLSRDVSNIVWGGTTDNLKLFYGYNANTSGSISYYKHIKSDASYYLVACYRKLDGEIGLYDIANNVFYTNQGTGTFLKGNDVDKTFYGGYVDLISGELVEEYYSIIADGENIKANSFYKQDNKDIFGAGIVYHSPQGIGANSFSNITNYYCNKLSFYSSTNSLTSDNLPFIYIPTAGALYSVFYISKISEHTELTTNAEKIAFVNDWLKENPTQIVYQLKTPITHQLTPTQLESFIGQNNFWSNADYVEIEYDLIETEDIQKCRKKIILNQPHTESVIDDVASFSTNMKAPLKECKVYFNPIQEGSGDPSPDNVRNIIGWDGVNVGLPSEYQEVEWIESEDNMGQYIDTLIAPNKTSIVTQFKFLFPKARGWQAVYGANGSSYSFIRNSANNSKTRIERWGYTNDTDISPSDVRYETIVEDSADSATVNGIQYSLKHGSGSVTGTFTIFTKKRSDGTTLDVAGSCRLFYFKIIDNGTPVFDGIPCYRKSDGEIGLYDIVTKTLFTNQGSGTFLKGADVNTIIGNVNWLDEIGTVYGGYVDLAKGEVVAEYESISDTWGNWGTLYDQGDGTELRYKKFTNNIIGGSAGLDSSYCNIAKYNYNNNNGTIHFYNVPTSNNCRIYLPSGTDTSLQIQAVAKLAEPIHYQLTPQQLLTFKGANNIWSNSNGQTEVKFWTH